MITLNPQYIKDADGNRSMVVLSSKEFDILLKELDELEDIRLYDESKADNTPPVPKKEAMAIIEAKRKKLSK